MENDSVGGQGMPLPNSSSIVTGRYPIERQLLLYGLPVILVAGTLGNAASALVLSRPRMRDKSVYFYLLLLSGADTLVLYTSGAKTWMRLVAGVEWLHTSDAACRALTFAFLAALHLSAWLIVLTTADRFVAVWFPLKAAAFCSQTRARLASLVLLVATVLFDGHVFWTFQLLPEERDENGTLIWKPECRPSIYSAAAEFMYGPFEYVKLATYSAAPFLIILTLNVAIVVRLRRTTPMLRHARHGAPAAASETVHLSRVGDSDSTAGHLCRRETADSRLQPRRGGEEESEAIQSVSDGRSGQSTTAAKGQAKVTTMLLVVSFAWLVLTVPFAAVGFIVAVGDIDADLVALLMPLKAVAFLLLYTNHAVNFYLYCLTGCRFRQELVDMLAGWRRAVLGRCLRQQPPIRRSTRWTLTTGNGGSAVTRSTARAAATHGSEHV